MVAIDAGLNIVGGNDFKDDKQAEDERGVTPAGEDGEREQRRGERGDGRSDVGDEAAKDGKRGEEDGVGESDEVERCADDGSVDDIDGDLEEEIAGDAAAGVAHGLGEEREVAVTGEMDKPVAKIFALKEDKESEHDGEQRSGGGLDDASELIEASRGTANYANLDGMFGSGADGT